MKTLLLILVPTIAAAQTHINGGRTISGPLNYCADAGSNDTYACTITDLTEYKPGGLYSFKANTANTGAATVNFSSIGAKTIVKVQGGITTALADNDIRAGQVVDLKYDGTNMQMQSTLGNAPASGPPALTSNAGDAPLWPFGAISSYDVHAMSANTIYLDAFTTQVSMQFRKCVFYVTTAAASGKGARCMVYTRASNGDVTVAAKSDGVLVDTTTAKTPAWSSGSLVSGGVLTLPAAQNYYLAVVSDGAPQIAAYALAGTQYLFRNGWNGSTFTVLSMVHSTSGVTGTGVNVDVGASITAANLSANLDRRLAWVGFLP